MRFIPIKASFGYYLIGEEITAQAQNIEVMNKLAYYDSISGKPNYAHFERDVKALVRIKDFNQERTTAIMFDVRELAFINRIFGRRNGNLLLKKTGNHLEEYGKHLDAAVSVQSVLDVFAKPFLIKDTLIKTDVSLGYSVFPYDGIILEGLLIKADRSLYCAKAISNDSAVKYIGD